MLAQELDVKQSWLARRALKTFLQRYKHNSKQLALDLGINK